MGVTKDEGEEVSSYRIASKKRDGRENFRRKH
jgi:hypothetical protein